VRTTYARSSIISMYKSQCSRE